MRPPGFNRCDRADRILAGTSGEVSVGEAARPARSVGLGRAVSRILSAPLPEERLICLSGPTRNRRDFRPARRGPRPGFLFGLAPDGVFRASTLARRAVGSYPTFSPLPGRSRAVCFLWHCPSGRLAALPPAHIPPPKRRVTRHRALWCSDFPLAGGPASEPPLSQDRPQHRAVGTRRQPRCDGPVRSSFPPGRAA